jgi:hypothetical protein
VSTLNAVEVAVAMLTATWAQSQSSFVKIQSLWNPWLLGIAWKAPLLNARESNYQRTNKKKILEEGLCTAPSQRWISSRQDLQYGCLV